MSYQKDRDEFIGVIVSEIAGKKARDLGRIGTMHDPRMGTNNEGVDLARLILRNAATIQRCEEAVCSSEAADRDRVPCPAIKSGDEADCACDQYGGEHTDTPRVQVQILRAQQRIKAACQPWGIKPNYQGDPRGCCVKLLLPSGRWNSFGGKEDGFCVPTR